MRVQRRVRLGVDIGGTKVAVIALDADSREVCAQTKFPTPGSYDALIAALTDQVSAVESTLQTSVTFGMCYPGSVPPGETTVHNSNLLWLNGKPFETDLSTALGRPIRTGNDANCFALSEALDGAGKGKSVVFGATLGTGLGGGVVIDGKILEGLNKLGGEWGHNPLPNLTEIERTVAPCYCGRTGCQESFLSATGLVAMFFTQTGERVSAEAIVERAENGDSSALATLVQYEERFARALGTVINVIDPDVIVLGGGLSSLKRLYENVPRYWQAYVFSSRPIRTQLLPAVFGPESGMRGAAWLWGG